MSDDVSTWVGVETLEKTPQSADDHVVWVIVPNTSNATSNDNTYTNGAAAANPMVISSTTETVYDSLGNKTNIEIAEITHQKKKMGRKNNAASRYVCDICGLKYSRNFNLRRHKENAHTQNSVTISCPHCPSTFTRHDNLTQHIKYVHNNLGSKNCPICGKHFAREHTMRDHLSVQHLQVKKYQCLQCGKLFGYPWSLYNHVRVKHESDGAFKCYYCSKVFSTIKHLRNHVLSIHEGVRYKCRLCNKILKCQSAYKAHLKLFHLPKENTGKFFCSRCNFACTSKLDLTRHMTDNHKWKSVNICPVCHKPVRYRSTFDRHVRFHNQDENDISTLLREHLKNNYSAIDGTSLNERNLNKEILRQSGVEPGPDFTASLIVSQNTAVTDVRPTSPKTTSNIDRDKLIFQCPLCNKMFNSRYLLDKHYEKCHSYRCSFCSALFFSYDAITQHERKFHAGESVMAENNMGSKHFNLLDDPENIWSLDPAEQTVIETNSIFVEEPSQDTEDGFINIEN